MRSQCPDSVPNIPIRGVSYESQPLKCAGQFLASSSDSGHWEHSGSAMMARVDLTDEAVKTLLIIGGDPASIAVGQPGIVITLEGIHVQPGEIPPDQGYSLLRELRTDACRLTGDRTLLPCPSFRGGGRLVALGSRASLADHAYRRLAVSDLEPKIEIRDIVSDDDRQHLEFEAAIRAFGPGFLE